MFPDIDTISIVKKQDMGMAGFIAYAKFNFGENRVLVKGWLYADETLHPDIHGYVIAKKLW
ncbi:MAG: hypothetical protein NC548_26060 [Lachnospiraceae bacterium]|nr:hypothetical protein [Lachnospiraceae bacterium]